MAMKELMMEASFRPASNPLGAERVVSPRGALPQAAERLDPRPPLFADETLIAVQRLHIDSASFRQLKASCADAAAIAARIQEIVEERGKMQNPVTGSGGMLLGEVAELGPEAPARFATGDRVATLVSLTLTPLRLETVTGVDLERGQVEVRGEAVLFASAPAVKLPSDLPETSALAVLDVCGAPTLVRRQLSGGERVLLLGAGHSAALSAFAAREKIPRESLWVSDCSERALERFSALGTAGRLFAADARDPLAFASALRREGAPGFDLVVNLCNAPETETAAILAARARGRVIFFNMATSFSRAVLSAEGLGRDVELVMGNGFAEGHAEAALGLLRSHQALRNFFAD